MNKTAGRIERVGRVAVSRPEPVPRPGAQKPIDLGSRLHELRTARGWTLEHASQRTGVARSTLSKIENGLMSPTFDIVQKLVSGLAVDISEFFRASQPSPAARRSVTRRNGGTIHEGPQYRMELLAADISNKAMLPLKVTIHARAFDDFADWIRHEGEEFICVISGEIEVLTEFYAPARLGVGESIYFDSEMRHAVISVSEQEAEVVWMATSRKDLPSDESQYRPRPRPAAPRS